MTIIMKEPHAPKGLINHIFIQASGTWNSRQMWSDLQTVTMLTGFIIPVAKNTAKEQTVQALFN